MTNTFVNRIGKVFLPACCTECMRQSREFSYIENTALLSFLERILFPYSLRLKFRDLVQSERITFRAVYLLYKLFFLFLPKKSGDILQNMNFSRYYRDRGNFIYSFDPNIFIWYYRNIYLFICQAIFIIANIIPVNLIIFKKINIISDFYF